MTETISIDGPSTRKNHEHHAGCSRRTDTRRPGGTSLFDVEYPAPGDPKLAEEVAKIAKPTHVGLDHVTWSVLVHAFPTADIPVVQLSIDARKRFEDHFDLGARLASLRASGALIMGSRNIVHNLRAIDWSRPDAGFDWARRFDDAARALHDRLHA